MYLYLQNYETHFINFIFIFNNLAEAVGFLRAKKSSARLPSEGK